MDKNRCLEIDLMKIISCLAVIAIHISAIGISDPDFDGVVRHTSLFFNGLSNFAVPSFIFLSGLSLMLRYGSRPLSTLDFLRKRMNNILIPYLGWSFAYFFIYVFAGFYAISLSNILAVIFLGTGEYHLYFVVILLQLYFLFPLIKPMVEGLDPWMTLAVAAGIHLGFAYLVQPFPYMDRVFIPYLIYFIAGMAWGANYATMKSWVHTHRLPSALIYLGACVLYLLFRFFPEHPLAVLPQLWELYSLASILALMTFTTSVAGSTVRPRWVSRILTLSAATFYVYLVHPLFIAGFFQLYSDVRGTKDMPLILPLSYAVVTALSFAFSLGYMRFKNRGRVQ